MLPKRDQNHQGLKILGRTWFTRGMHESSSLTGLQPSVTILRLLVVWRRFPSDRWERRLVWARKYELSTRRGLTVNQWELHRHWKILDFLVKKDRGSRLDFILATSSFYFKRFQHWVLAIENYRFKKFPSWNYKFKRIRIINMICVL